ncbi:MAG: NACHT domain-containing protein [Acidobacteriota bacterium]|nr:NACHT domain-containing protein [Acidobacteriota bacterium]
MESTYVDLDVAPSDLSQSRGNTLRPVQGFAKPYVLVGGPGAGKSTLAKHLVLRSLGDRRAGMPILLKLRDYVGFDNIESAIAHRLSDFKFARPKEYVDGLLRNSATLCVLDGLDEVRVESRNEVIRHINQFFHKYFDQGGQIIVTCRKEAYRDTPLDIPSVMEVRPLSDEQIQRLAEKWPIAYPQGKSFQTFLRDLTAAPRIHELARSPLLLVGGLMQYTDSNQGIPDERFQYLNRVATWLIADWSTAQGHPPDPLRPLYDRVLPRLAYHMHQTKCAEVNLADAVTLIDGWLPQFGHPKGGASQVIESIKTRTGILVSENAQHLIFAQFGLQEYFASLEVTEQVKPSDLSTLTPIPWWRESILLAVAQQREPTAYLEALFLFDSFLAAAAVAECPTPSSVLQKRAVEACLRGIDKMETSVTGALVPLLRKCVAT